MKFIFNFSFRQHHKDIVTFKGKYLYSLEHTWLLYGELPVNKGKYQKEKMDKNLYVMGSEAEGQTLFTNAVSVLENWCQN